jgi:multidrug resistance efflux pump
MLNIGKESTKGRIDVNNYTVFRILDDRSVSTYLIKIILGAGIICLIALFLPWTQNIRSEGAVTTLNPYDKPQTVQSLISGRIETWYVQEGQFVNKGDTIIVISEAKEEYLDPDLIARTQDQINAKTASALAYGQKADNLQNQFDALIRNKEIKLRQNQIKIQQTRLSIMSDSMDLVASQLKLQIADQQLKRIESLFKDGIKSLTDLETKRYTFQEAQAKVVSLENKLEKHYNELSNLNAEVEAIENDFQDKVSKSKAEQMSSLSDQFSAEASVNKLQSQFNAYTVRQNNYVVRSPINGYVTQAIKSGIGEIVKGGEDIISISPENYDLAVETYVKPRDLPLLEVGQKVRILFDGWPAIVFSGWPQNSYGTFGGKIFAIDNFISDNGKYRILISPDESDKLWPEELRVGGGANSLFLLKNVRVWYEIWRQMNGFPPDYYKKGSSDETKLKAPLRKVK